MSNLEQNVKEAKEYLELNDCNWCTALIDHTYNTITIYTQSSGLNPEWDMGDDWEDWYSEDLFTYAEFLGEELSQLEENYIITLTSRE